MPPAFPVSGDSVARSRRYDDRPPGASPAITIGRLSRSELEAPLLRPEAEAGSPPGRSRILVTIDATDDDSDYAGRMSPQRRLARYLVEIIAAVFAVLGLVEIWVAPTSGSKLVTVPTALLATLPLLLRRRFPLAAPIVVFAAVAAIAAAWPDDVKHGATLPFFALLLAFWIVGAENELHQAIAGVAAGFAAAALIAAGEGNLHP